MIYYQIRNGYVEWMCEGDELRLAWIRYTVKTLFFLSLFLCWCWSLLTIALLSAPNWVFAYCFRNFFRGDDKRWLFLATFFHVFDVILCRHLCLTLTKYTTERRTKEKWAVRMLLPFSLSMVQLFVVCFRKLVCVHANARMICHTK